MPDYLTGLFNLGGKVAALTGAGGYLVGEISRGLAKAGIKTALLDANLEIAEKLASEIRAGGGEAMAAQVDVRRRDDFMRVLASILEKYGDLDFVLNGAGINAPTRFLQISLEAWHDILEGQLTGTMLSCQVFGAYLIQKKKGSIINITSTSSGPPLSKALSYSVAIWIGMDTIILKSVTIGDNTVIGASCIIAKNVGRNSIIRAGSVVLKRIPENSMSEGNPAMVISREPNYQ